MQKPDVKAGGIPEQLTYISKAPQKIKRFHHPWKDKDSGEEITVIPTFVSDAANKKTVETGMNWAEGNYWQEKKHKPVVMHRPNEPIQGIRIFDLEVRAEGGRAYKAIIDPSYYVDLREDVLMDTIQEVGIQKGGILNGTFIFGKVGSQMKLVRVGSELHKQLIAANDRSKISKFSKADLIPGHLYQTKAKKKAIFLGLVNARQCEIDEGYRYSGRSYTISKVLDHNNVMLWWEPYNFQDASDYKSTWKEQFEEPWAFHLKFRTSHSMVEDLGKVDFSGDDPLNELKTKRTKLLAKLLSGEVKLKAHHPGDPRADYNKSLLLALFSSTVNICRPSEELKIDPAYENFNWAAGTTLMGR